MYRPRATLALAVLAGSFAITAHAGLTREQVKAELMEAIRTGNMPANDESGLTDRELHPSRYPAVQASAAPLTRAQVLAQFEEARRTGDLYAPGESGLRLNELNPQAYPAKVAVAGRSRAEVQAELREALRTGNILAGGEAGLLLKDMYPQRYANVAPAEDANMQASSQNGTTMR